MSLRDELLARFPALATLPPHSIVVGGAIRDLLMHRIPADVDVECESAERVAARVGKIILLGRGDMKVYRTVKDGLVYDFSEPTEIRRRDFTINAIALDLTSEEITDPFEGRDDLRRRLLRMIEPKNFQDDPLRVLRGVRLALQLDFTIDPHTLEAMRRRAAQVTTMAAERVAYELEAIFSFGKFRQAVALLHDAGLDEPLFGYPLDAAQFKADDVSCAAAFALILRVPPLFAGRWKWSRELLREVTTLQHLLRDPDLLAIYEARAADLPAMFRATGREVPPMPDFNVRALLDGNEIGQLTGGEGPRLGGLKRALIEAQLKGEVKTRDEAVKFVQSVSRT
jgi:tRNA nucleotidyltransferase/poly(A) polymerase